MLDEEAAKRLGVRPLPATLKEALDRIEVRAVYYSGSRLCNASLCNAVISTSLFVHVFYIQSSAHQRLWSGPPGLWSRVLKVHVYMM